MIKRGLALLLCAFLLLSGATAENAVEILPTAPPMPALTHEENPYAFEDLSAYYQDEWEYQTPAFTASEKERLSDAQKRYDAGDRPQSSILNLMENVVLSLIELPAQQYEGESWFLILPNRELTDEELLQVVDAYQQLGISLDPSCVNWHNAIRGGAASKLRGYTEEEAERYTAIADLYNRSGLRSESPFTLSVLDDGVGQVSLEEESFNGLSDYTFYPARRLTDDELLQLYAFRNGEPSAQPGKMAEYEMQLRRELNRLLGMPITARRTYENLQAASDGNVFGDDREIYLAQFEEIGENGRNWTGRLEIESGTLISASAILNTRYYMDDTLLTDVRYDPYDSKWAQMAQNTVGALWEDGYAEIASVQAVCENHLNQLPCALLRVGMQDGAVYRVYIAYVLDQAVYVEYNDAQSIALEDDYYIQTLMREEAGNNG